MSLFTRDKFLTDEDENNNEAGISLSGLGVALVTWTAMQSDYPVSVASAALAFNTTDDVIRDALERAQWASWNVNEFDPEKQFIELDGEY